MKTLKTKRLKRKRPKTVPSKCFDELVSAYLLKKGSIWNKRRFSSWRWLTPASPALNLVAN